METGMPSRSLKVHSHYTATVNAAYEQEYGNGRYSSQREFAALIKVDDTKTGIVRDTLINFLAGEAVDRPYFFALCDRLGLKALDITQELSEEETLESSTEASEPEQVQQPSSKPRTVKVKQTVTHVTGLMIGYVEGDINTTPPG